MQRAARPVRSRLRALAPLAGAAVLAVIFVGGPPADATPRAVVGPPTAVTVDPLANTVRVSWTPPAGTVSAYNVRVFETGGGLGQVGQVVDGSTTSIALAPIQDATTYRAEVTAFGGGGQATSDPSAAFGSDHVCTVTGTAGDDVLSGTAGDDSLCGLQGDDTFVFSGGGDTYVGGQGDDVVDLGAAPVGVRASLFFGGPVGVVDLGNDIDQQAVRADGFLGTAFADDLTGLGDANLLAGRGGDDFLSGLRGNDVLRAGAGDDIVNPDRGRDTIDGGGGTDEIRLIGASGGVGETVDLTAGTATGDEGVDTLTGIENVTTGPNHDTLRGDGGANVLDGGASGDRIFGLGGDDLLLGEQNPDRLDGGTGTDVCNGGTGPGIDTAVRCETVIGVP